MCYVTIVCNADPFLEISDANLKCALWVSLLLGIDPEEGGPIVEILLIS